MSLECYCCLAQVVEEFFTCIVCSEKCCKSCYALELGSCQQCTNTGQHLAEDPSHTMATMIRAWFKCQEPKNNSGATTRNLGCHEGEMQLKWWRQKGRLIVKTVELKESFRGQGLFTATCRQLLAEFAKIKEIEMESVLEDELVMKLQAMGWQIGQSENQLFLRK